MSDAVYCTGTAHKYILMFVIAYFKFIYLCKISNPSSTATDNMQLEFEWVI